MADRIVIIVGHPDPDPARFNHALARAYTEGAREAGRECRVLTLAEIEFPLLRSRKDWEQGEVPAAVREGQEAIHWAEHVMFLYPLWLGDVPALLKAYLEQVMRPGYAVGFGSGTPKRLLKGRSARIVVTMGMPALFYRLYFGAHSVASFKRNILGLVGIHPVRTTLIGGVEGKAEKRQAWLEQMKDFGRDGC
jgi:putative NADPH-quinone reductase